MKTFHSRYKIACAILCLTALFSCKKDITSTNDSLPGNMAKNMQPLSSSVDYTEFLAGYTGADTSEIKLVDSTYIIQGDMKITADNARKLMLAGETAAQARHSFYLIRYPVAPYYIQNVKVKLEISNPDWYNASVDAINQWNAIATANSSSIRFSVVSSGEYVKIRDGINEDDRWIARAPLPYIVYFGYSNTYGPVMPGYDVEINEKYNYLSTSSKMLAIVHELGHTIGYMHTDQNDGEQIPGTPASDEHSVMHSENKGWRGFTTGDIQAIQAIYPGGPYSNNPWPFNQNFGGNTARLPRRYAPNNVESTWNPVANGTKIYMSSTPILTMGQSIYSPNGLVRLTFQGDGNIVVIARNASNGSERALWSTNTPGRGATKLAFQYDGNLVVYNNANQSLWGSNIYEEDGSLNLYNVDRENEPFYYLQNDGNFVLYWPAYHTIPGYSNLVAQYVILGAADTGGANRTPHEGNLYHTHNNPVPSNNLIATAASYVSQP